MSPAGRCLGLYPCYLRVIYWLAFILPWVILFVIIWCSLAPRNLAGDHVAPWKSFYRGPIRCATTSIH